MEKDNRIHTMFFNFTPLRITALQDTADWDRADMNFLIKQCKKIYKTIPGAPRTASLEILFTHDNHMRQLKKDFLQQDMATNVLSFPHHDSRAGANLGAKHGANYGANLGAGNHGLPKPTHRAFLGSIALGYGIIKEEAREANKDFRHHLVHLGIHGLLHLLDFNHDKKSAAEKMERLEILLLSNLGIKNPYQ